MLEIIVQILCKTYRLAFYSCPCYDSFSFYCYIFNRTILVFIWVKHIQSDCLSVPCLHQRYRWATKVAIWHFFSDPATFCAPLLKFTKSDTSRFFTFFLPFLEKKFFICFFFLFYLHTFSFFYLHFIVIYMNLFFTYLLCHIAVRRQKEFFRN